ncbi:MAG: MBL fold metallo-hydrolase [Clostridiales bacterium]|nr:MBL fold metallo-hydrolase [Clostridiales bacterium]
MKIQVMPVGALQANCYIVYAAGDSGELAGVVIDPGAEGAAIASFLEKEGIRVSSILLTHVHFDHIQGVPALQRATGARLLAPRGDQPALSDPEKSLLTMAGAPPMPLEADRLLDDGDVVEEGPLRLTVMNTPGHTPGSCCYLSGDVIFSGDTLFAQSIGRTDFPGGSFEQLSRSLARLASLPGDYRILPGHGEFTTLERERALNPYMAR